MIYDELHSRYGSHIARRVQQELSADELKTIATKNLLNWLEVRAQSAHKEYEIKLENPFTEEELNSNGDYVVALYRRWQKAEELAYLISVAEGATTNLPNVSNR